MAEIRKHQPNTSAIGRAVMDALGENVRPVTPGARPVARDAEDPFAPQETATTVAGSGAGALPGIAFGTSGATLASGSWLSLAAAVPPAADDDAAGDAG